MAEFQYAQQIMDWLSRGAFLTTRENGKVNTMTIGWGSLGVIWGKQIFTVMVRDSRFTKSAMDHTSEFTVSIPMDDKLKSELGFCGSNSGKETDKIKECGLLLIDSEKVTVPTVSCNGVAIECRTVYRQRMDADALDSEIRKKWYSDGDMHTLYYGEIVNIRKI